MYHHTYTYLWITHTHTSGKTDALKLRKVDKANRLDIEISIKGIRKLLQNLNPPKAAGLDNIPCQLLKLVAQEIAPALTLLFRKSINTGEVQTA